MSENNAVDSAYGGFWIRLGATILDGLLLLAITFAAVRLLYGKTLMEWRLESLDGIAPSQIFLDWLLPAIYTIGMWILASATIGKMIVKIRIVDARTGDPASPLRCVLRYLGYIVSTVPLGLGFLWIAFDKKKQGWHDKIAGTLVFRHE